MKQVKITTTSDLINGGCNACPNVKCTNYLVHVEDETIALETLTVADLVTLLALKEGFLGTLVVALYTKECFEWSVFLIEKEFSFPLP